MTGAGRAFDIGANTGRWVPPELRMSVEESLRRDWHAVGDDLRTAIDAADAKAPVHTAKR